MRRPPVLGVLPFQKAPRPQRLPAIPVLRGLRDEIHPSSPSLMLLPERDRCTPGNVDSRNQRSRRAICSTPAQEVYRSPAGGGLRPLFDLRYLYSHRTIERRVLPSPSVTRHMTRTSATARRPGDGALPAGRACPWPPTRARLPAPALDHRDEAFAAIPRLAPLPA